MGTTHWLKDLQEGEVILGFYSEARGLTGQGRLFRVKTRKWRPLMSPETWGTDFVDDALISTITAINEGLACAESELVLIREVTNRGHPIFFKDNKLLAAEEGEEYEALRRAFNFGHNRWLHIRFVVERRT